MATIQAFQCGLSKSMRCNSWEVQKKDNALIPLRCKDYVRLVDEKRPTDQQMAAKRLQICAESSAASTASLTSTSAEPAAAKRSTPPVSSVTTPPSSSNNLIDATATATASASSVSFVTTPPPLSLFAENPEHRPLHRPITMFDTVGQINTSLQEYCFGGIMMICR